MYSRRCPLNIHEGLSVEDSPIIKTDRVMIGLLEEDHFESFHMGFCDRYSEELDNSSYKKVNEIKTIRELFYLLGYTIATRELFYSNIVKKNLPLLGDFKGTVCNYLNRFDLLTFYQKNI